jgi:AraC-like DNA-binding protein
MTTDTLSNVLRAVRFRGAVFFDVEGRPPWVAEAPPSRELAPQIMPDAEHLIEFHGVVRGACWAARTGEPAVRLEAGDVVLFPHGDAHVMSSAPGLRAQLVNPAPPAPPERLPLPLSVDAAGVARPREGDPHPASTHLVCGFLGLDARPFNPLLDALPRLLTLREAASAPSWIAALLTSAVAESRGGRPGSEAVLARMSEVLFVEAVRRHVEGLGDDEAGWLAGTRDPAVGRALALLHADPARPWTLEALHEASRLSRSAFHERFVHFVGLPPMQYLTRWRMQLASRLLRDTTLKVVRIALDVGYESEAAFVRAFRREVGMAPGAWRKAAAAPGGVGAPQGA